MPTRQPITQRPPIFHKKGLAYFWVLNDYCNLDQLQPQLDAFAKAGNVSALCLHPRPGLLLPYGGSDWFEFIRDLTKRIAKAGLDTWLYDEDPYPSGAAGGRVFQERPEFNARYVEQYVFDPKIMEDDIFGFPVGETLWVGLVNDATGETIDHTKRVGTLRRKWSTWERWDSRFFYPDTPIYKFQRADTGGPEYGITVPKIPPGFKLVAYVSRPIAFDWISWGGVPDSLNPAATKFFLDLTHEQYKKYMGDMFGKEVKAIFTDEPKYFSKYVWTPGMEKLFKAKHGYDIRPKLHHLFSNAMSDEAILTRSQFRQFVGQRFIDAWLKPVGDWCKRNKLNLVGHISPEDEPIEQANYVTNMFPIFPHFGLAGIDVIIPAVGDRNHPILSVGCTCATSASQQNLQAGVMSETGACTAGVSGKDITGAKIGRILKWQVVMGVTSPLIHCAYSSTRGPRAYEYPPNYGPNNADLWPQMPPVHKELVPLQEVMHDARQIAPVVILWNVRSFWVENIDWLNDTTGMRRSMMDTLSALLDRQVGAHFIDEAALWKATLKGKELTLGLARYKHILVPSCSLLHAKTIKRLKELQDAGVDVTFTGNLPTRADADDHLEPVSLGWARRATPAQAADAMPRLIELQGNTTDIRCTAWEKKGKTRRLMINLNPEPFTAKFERRTIKLAPAQAVVVD